MNRIDDLKAPAAPLSDEASALLDLLVEARAAMALAARDTVTAADELRRYAKFSRPGQPSAHIVQLRQKQAAARMDSARSRAAFLRAAQAFVRVADLVVPPKTALEAFMLAWVDRHAPAPGLP